MKLLLIEDEEILSNIIAKGLRKLGYAVDTVYNGEEALIKYSINEYDLIILDLNIPKISGLDVLSEIRKSDQITKILVLSARSKVNDRVIGLNLGANDYLVKPFDFIELEARVHNLLRRSFTQLPSKIVCGKLILDMVSKKIFYGDSPLNLTKKEYCILEYLMISKNHVVSAEKLIEHVWDSDFDPFSNVLRYHMHTLKRKLKESGGLNLINTIRGQGYIIEEENNESVK